MKEIRLHSLLLQCQLYHRAQDIAREEGHTITPEWGMDRKLQIAEEVLDAFSTGEIEAAVREYQINSVPQSRSFIFMDDNGNSEYLEMTADQIMRGEWATSKAELESRGYTFICWGMTP